MESDVFTAVTFHIVSVWVMTPCKPVSGYHTLEEIFYFITYPEKEAETFSYALVITYQTSCFITYNELCLSFGGLLPASDRGLISVPDHFVWDLWWTKWRFYF